MLKTCRNSTGLFLCRVVSTCLPVGRSPVCVSMCMYPMFRVPACHRPPSAPQDPNPPSWGCFRVPGVPGSVEPRRSRDVEPVRPPRSLTHTRRQVQGPGSGSVVKGLGGTYKVRSFFTKIRSYIITYIHTYINTCSLLTKKGPKTGYHCP